MKVIRTVKHRIYNCEQVAEVFGTDFCVRAGWDSKENYIVGEDENKYILEDDVEVQTGWRVRDGKVIHPDTEVLEDIKVDKLLEIKEARKACEYGGVEFNGLIIETDNDSQAKLTSAMTAYQMVEVTPGIWKCQNGWLPAEKFSDFMAICMVVQAHVNECFLKEYKLAEAIMATQNIREVRGISWTI